MVTATSLFFASKGFIFRTLQPVSELWNVTRFTMPESFSETFVLVNMLVVMLCVVYHNIVAP